MISMPFLDDLQKVLMATTSKCQGYWTNIRSGSKTGLRNCTRITTIQNTPRFLA